MFPTSLSCCVFEWFSDGFCHGGLSRSLRNSSLSEKKSFLDNYIQLESFPQEGKKLFYDTFTKFQEYAFCFERILQIMKCFSLSFVGSVEEQWYLEIVDKGSVSCPTCQAVGRKTIEGLKKHMETCKQVRDFVAFRKGYDLFQFLGQLSLCRVC